MNKKYIIGGVVMAIVGAWYTFKNKRLDKAGLGMIKAYEGLSLEVYNDVAGLSTIGYGHLIKQGEIFDTLTNEEAEQLLIKDVKQFENAVNDFVKVPLSQNMFNGLVSLTYNIGVNGFKNSTVLIELNNGNYIAAANGIALWNKATINGEKVVVQGLVNRRKYEQTSFFS